MTRITITCNAEDCPWSVTTNDVMEALTASDLHQQAHRDAKPVSA
jgi:hypothetical protein